MATATLSLGVILLVGYAPQARWPQHRLHHASVRKAYRASALALEPATALASGPAVAAPLDVAEATRIAEAEALAALDWPRLSAHVGAYASTPAARQLLLRGDGLPLPRSRAESERLHALTEATLALRARTGSWPALGGVCELGSLGTAAKKGVQLDEAQLSDVASTLGVAAALAKGLKAAAEGGDGSDGSDGEEGGGAGAIEPLWATLRGVALCAELRQLIAAAIDEGGRVRDSASPELAKARAAANALRASIRRKLQAIAQGPKSDALVERAPVLREGRYCLAVRASQRARFKGANFVAESGTGSTLFLEPSEVSGARRRAPRRAPLANGVGARASAAHPRAKSLWPSYASPASSQPERARQRRGPSRAPAGGPSPPVPPRPCHHGLALSCPCHLPSPSVRPSERAPRSREARSRGALPSLSRAPSARAQTRRPSSARRCASRRKPCAPCCARSPPPSEPRRPSSARSRPRSSRSTWRPRGRGTRTRRTASPCA